MPKNNLIKCSPALQAYNAFNEKNGPEPILPELNMTSKELFFIGYAQVLLVM